MDKKMCVSLKNHIGAGVFCLFLFWVSCRCFAVDNPITYIADVHDCDVIKYNGEYYLSGNWIRGDMISSRDLENWGNRTHVFSWNNTWHTAVNPSDPYADIHGTHIRYVNGTFHLYAHLGTTSVDGFTHAVSSSIWGPYTEPVNSRFAQNIDADTFIDENGSMYFYMTKFSSGESVWWQAMTATGTLTGSSTRLIYPSSQDNWYGTNTINEGSKVFKYRGKYYMLYNAYATDNPNYSFGCVEAASPTTFANAGKYTSPVLTRGTPGSGEEINTIGQPWVVEGLNGFERWIGYFGITASEGRTQRIDRMHFFHGQTRSLYIDGPTNRYSTGYHPGPAEPQLRSLFYLPDGAMPAEDWTVLWGSGSWNITANEARQSTQNSFSFNTVNRASATNYLFEANVKFTDARDAEDKCGVLAYYQDDNNWMIVGLDRSLYQTGAVDCWYSHRRENGADTIITGNYSGSINYLVYHKIRVEKNGSSFKIRIDDKTPPNLSSGTVSTLFSGAGKPGLYVDHAAAAFDGVIYTIGWDEYDGSVQSWGASLSGIPQTGTWGYSSGGITQSLAAIGINRTFKGDLMPQYEFSAQVTKSVADGSMGIMPVAIDLNNYLVADVNLVTDKLSIYGLKNGVSIPYQEVAVSNLTTYNLRAVKLSDRIILFVNGVEKMTVYQSFGPSQVGLSAQNMAAQYNGILVYRTEPKNAAPWLDADVGTVGFAGSSNLREGTFSISGSGTDIFNLHDSFHFTYRPWNGDGEIIAKVESIDPTGVWAKAGLMFRNNFNDNSTMVFMAVNSNTDGRGSRYDLIWRSTAGSGCGYFIKDQADMIPSASWLKLSRQGSTFKGWYSQDGTNWTLLGSASIPTISSACYVGPIALSYDNTRLCGTVFDNVSTSSETRHIPSPWQAVNLGNAGNSGGADYNFSAFTVEGSGSGVGGTADQFQYVNQPLSGIGQITARLTALSATDTTAKAGIMFRKSLAVGASNLFLYVNKNGYLQMSRRQSDNATTDVYTVPGGTVTLPVQLLLKRTDFLGCAFELYYSTNGSAWTQIVPTGNLNLSCMDGNAYAGLAVTSTNNSNVASAVFDNVSVQQQCTIAPPQGDIDYDCTVDIADLDILADQWLSSGGGTTNADIYPTTPDAMVDFKDFVILAQNWLDDGLILADTEIRDIIFFLKRLQTVESMPELESSHTAMSSTWDRNGGNADGDDYKRIENGYNILLDINGPGCVHRIFTGTLDSSIADTRIQIYLDNSATPIFDMPVTQFFNDTSGPLTYPLVFHKSYPGVLFPIPFEKHIYVRLVNSHYGAPEWNNNMWGNFWQLTYTQYAPEINVKSLSWPLNTAENAQLQSTCTAWLSAESNPPAELPDGYVDNIFSIDPGQIKNIPLSGCGIIRQMRVSPFSEAVRGLRIRMYWDGSASPSVDVPIEYFFGIANSSDYGRTITSPFVVMGREFSGGSETYTPYFNSLLMGVTSTQMYCAFPMPFANGAILQFENKGTAVINNLNVRLNVETLSSLSPQLGRFHATWTQDYAATDSDPTFQNVPVKTALDRRCRGKYVGMLLSLDWPSTEWWGEGDWEIWSDENSWPPSYHGTGSEEYFNSGWCHFDRKAISGFATVHPSHPIVYSFHLNDAFQFSSNIRIAEEYMGLGNGDTYLKAYHPLWRSTAFWYALPAQPAGSD